MNQELLIRQNTLDCDLAGFDDFLKIGRKPSIPEDMTFLLAYRESAKETASAKLGKSWRKSRSFCFSK